MYRAALVEGRMIKIRSGNEVFRSASKTIDTVIAEFNIKSEHIRVANSVEVKGDNIEALLTIKAFIENTTYRGAKLGEKLPVDVSGDCESEVDFMGRPKHINCRYVLNPDFYVYLGDDLFAMVERGRVVYVADRYTFLH